MTRRVDGARGERYAESVSKAFTSEETEDPAILGRTVVRSAPGDERPITARGHRALLERRDALGRERAAEASGSDRARELEHRMALLAATLEAVRVAPPATGNAQVGFGKRVTIRWEDGRAQRVVLVGPDEAETDRISIGSPLARALDGRRVGDVVEIERPRGTMEAEVLAIDDEPV